MTDVAVGVLSPSDGVIVPRTRRGEEEGTSGFENPLEVEFPFNTDIISVTQRLNISSVQTVDT